MRVLHYCIIYIKPILQKLTLYKLQIDSFMLHYIHLITNRDNSSEKFWRKETKSKGTLTVQS